MRRDFDTERFDLVDVDSVHINDHTFGHNNHGELDVWTASGATGTAFVHQISVRGVTGPASQGVYGRACFFLRERATGRFFFLERDARGYYLQNEEFFGAAAFLGAEAVKVEAWLAGRSSTRPSVLADRYAPLTL